MTVYATVCPALDSMIQKTRRDRIFAGSGVPYTTTDETESLYYLKTRSVTSDER